MAEVGPYFAKLARAPDRFTSGREIAVAKQIAALTTQLREADDWFRSAPTAKEKRAAHERLTRLERELVALNTEEADALMDARAAEMIRSQMERA